MSREFKCIGMLPQGDWMFLLVQIDGEPDAVLVVDKTGCTAPRMIINGKLVNVEPQ